MEISIEHRMNFIVQLVAVCNKSNVGKRYMETFYTENAFTVKGLDLGPFTYYIHKFNWFITVLCRM